MMTNFYQSLTALDTNKNFSSNVLKIGMQTSGSHGAMQWKGNL